MKKLMIAMFLLLILVSSALAEAKTIILNSRNHVVLNDDIMPDSVELTIMQLADLVQKRGNYNYPIYLVMRSNGGMVVEGNKLAEYMKGQKKMDTVSIVSISAAAYIVEANPGVRYVTKDSKMMFHQMVLQFCGNIVSEEAELVKQAMDNLIVDRENYADTISKRLGVSKDEYVSKIPGTDQLWFSGDELLGKDGMKPADEMVELKCESKMSRALTDCEFKEKEQENEN